MSLRTVTFASLASLLVACGSSAPGASIAQDSSVENDSAGADAGASESDVAATDASVDGATIDVGADGDADDVGTIGSPMFSVAATSGTLTANDVAADIAGAGTSAIGAIAIAKGAGTVALGGASGAPATQAFVMAHQPFGDDLFQTVAVDPDRVTVLWFYCAGGDLQFVYWEDSRGGPMQHEAATGTCTFTTGTESVAVDVPAFAFDAPAPPTGWTFSATDATQLAFDGTSPGHIVVAGTSLALYPFDTVDCSACGSGGWQEIHSFFWDESRSALTFGILYLFPPSLSRPMQLSYSLTLPTLAQPADETFAGTWSHTP